MLISVSKGQVVKFYANPILFSIVIKDSQHRGEIAARRRNIFRRQNSGISLKSVSEYNTEMEVMRSMVGESVVPLVPQKREGLKILCLDGGGMKVKNLASCSAC
jgi:hypothetical protein